MKSAILITFDKESIANESAALAKAADFNVVYTIKKKFLNKPKYGISDLTELKTACEDLNPDVIIFDSILSPRKNYNLAGALEKPILDRETLILNIFEARARKFLVICRNILAVASGHQKSVGLESGIWWHVVVLLCFPMVLMKSIDFHGPGGTGRKCLDVPPEF